MYSSTNKISLTVAEIKAAQKAAKKILFIDVREKWERDIYHLEESMHIPTSTIEEFDFSTLPANQYDHIIIYCQHGVRSTQAAHLFRSKKILNASSMQGGLAAWLSNTSL